MWLLLLLSLISSIHDHGTMLPDFLSLRFRERAACEPLHRSCMWLRTSANVASIICRR